MLSMGLQVFSEADTKIVKFYDLDFSIMKLTFS